MGCRLLAGTEREASSEFTTLNNGTGDDQLTSTAEIRVVRRDALESENGNIILNKTLQIVLSSCGSESDRRRDLVRRRRLRRCAPAAGKDRHHHSVQEPARRTIQKMAT